MQERRSPSAEKGSESAKQPPSGLCPERLARVPLSRPDSRGPASGLPDADQGIRRQERRSPSAERGSGSAKQLPSCLCLERRARVPLLRGPASGLLDADQGIMQRERRSPSAERGSERAKQLPSGLCLEQRPRVPLLCGPARGLQDVDQDSRQQECSSP